MNPDLVHLQGKITTTIQEANKAFEEGWAGLAQLTSLFGARNETEISLHRLMSYNPSNPLVENSSFYPAVTLLTGLITAKQHTLETQDPSAQDWITLGHCYLMLSDYVNAYTTYTQALRLDAKNSNRDGYFWYGIGIVYQHFRYYPNAIEFYQKCQQCLPDFEPKSVLDFRLALCLRSANSAAEATRIFSSLLTTPPPGLAVDDIKFHLAFTYQASNQPERATALYQELSVAHPRSLEIAQQFAWHLSLLQDPNTLPMAENYVNSLPAEFQSDPMIQLVNAKLAMRQQDMSTAYQRYCECITFWSDNPLFWCGLGVLYFKNDQMQDSVIAFQRALYLNGDIPEAWLNLGLIFELKSDIQNANRIYSAGIQNCTDSRQLKERLNQLNVPMNIKPKAVLVEVTDSRLFTQVAEKVADIQMANAPILPGVEIGLAESDQRTLDLLAADPVSLFSPNFFSF